MSDDAVDAFWADARVRVNLNAMRVYTGPNVLEAIRPPAWSFGGTPEQADVLLELVLSGRKTATASVLRDYEAEGEGESPPSAGSLSIITDGAGQPRALICTTEVRIVPFDEVDEEHARLEGEGDLTLTHWREVHREFFASSGHVTPETEIVLERFRVVHRTR